MVAKVLESGPDTVHTVRIRLLLALFVDRFGVIIRKPPQGKDFRPEFPIIEWKSRL